MKVSAVVSTSQSVCVVLWFKLRFVEKPAYASLAKSLRANTHANSRSLWENLVWRQDRLGNTRLQVQLKGVLLVRRLSLWVEASRAGFETLGDECWICASILFRWPLLSACFTILADHVCNKIRRFRVVSKFLLVLLQKFMKIQQFKVLQSLSKYLPSKIKRN